MTVRVSADQLIEGMKSGEEEAWDFRDKYWLASAYYSEDFGAEVMERFSDHIDVWDGSPLGNAIWKAYRAYHGLTDSINDQPMVSIYSSGEGGELLNLDINLYRELVKRQLAMVAAQRPAWDPQARTNDSAAAEQIPLTRNFLDYDMSSALQDKLYEQLEVSKVAASAFLVSGWDPNTGLDGRGWLTARVLTPWEMAHERVRDYDAECSWWIFRAYESRWDWCARFAKADPEKARKIYEIDSSDELFANAFLGYEASELERHQFQDRLPVLYVIAKPTIACPQGRLAIVAAEDLVLLDGPSPYGDMVPISRMASATFIGTSIPCADSWSLLAPCDAYNAVSSAILTRVDMGAVPNIAVPSGYDFRPSDMGGNNVIEAPVGGTDPHVIELLSIPGELPAVMKLLGENLENLSGVNSVTRGQPAENITSGSMAALMQSMAVQFNSNDERAWALNLERVGTQRIRIFQRMASEELIVAVSGKDVAGVAKRMKGEDLKDILRVAVKIANPLQKLTAGRLELAKDLLQYGSISPADYLRVAETGTLEETFAGVSSHLNTVRAENETLLDGKAPRALWFDNHQLHIREHLELAKQDVRYDEQRLAVISAHLEEHMKLWEELSRTAPDRLAAIGCPPLPQASAIGQQGQAMRTPMGAPPPRSPPPQEGPRQQEQPRTVAPAKGAKPGPTPGPGGQEPSMSAPKEPMPSKTPNGAPAA